MSFRLSTAIFWLVVASVVARLLLSSWLLDSWYPYSAEGGQPYHKIHPGSIVAFFGVATIGFVKGVPSLLRHLWRTQHPTVIYLAGVLFVSGVSTFFHGMSGAAYLIDTFLAAGCYPILMAFVSPDRVLRIANVVLVIVGINAALAITEYAGGFHVLPQPYSYGFFRASALFGHPLANGLLTASCMFLALAMPWRGQVKAGYAALLLLSLFAFGARGALLVSTVGVVLAILAFPHVTQIGRRNRAVMLPLTVAGVALVAIAIAGVLFGTEFGYTIASRMAADDSTGARLASVEVVGRFSTGELVRGVAPQTLAYLLEMARVPIVENFWVGMLLRLGLPLLLVLVAATAVLLLRYMRHASFYVRLAFVVFVVVASTNNSLATKSCALVVVVTLLSAIALHSGRSRAEPPR